MKDVVVGAGRASDATAAATTTTATTRKRWCLFAVLLFMTLVICANVAMTTLLVYHINLLDSSLLGGAVRLRPDFGTTLKGHVMVDKTLSASVIESSRDGGDLHLVSGGTLILASAPDGRRRPNSSSSTSFVKVGGDGQVVFQADSVRFRSSDGQDLLGLSKDSVDLLVSAVNLKGRARSVGSLQTRTLLAAPGANLKISSPTKSAEVRAAGDLDLGSTAGDVSIRTLNTANLVASNISIVSTNVFMPGIIISKDDDRVPPQPRPGGEQGATAHEVCVCANGRIFAAWSPEVSLGRGCQALAPIACE